MNSITSTLAAIRSGDTNAETVANDSFAMIANEKFNAFHECWSDRTCVTNNEGPLLGSTIAIKDNIATIRGTTTCGSKMLEGYSSPFNATVVDKLIDSGATLVGKT
ncbi:MAG: amidase family protein, partial [Phycisphaerales bacterium]|nr:amidase family protein [Phycisphaerales bacterium]